MKGGKLIESQKIKEESKYKALINIFSQNPYTLYLLKKNPPITCEIEI